MPVRNISIRCLPAALLAFALLGSPGEPQAQPAALLLRGEPLERAMAGGETHSYRVEARAGTRLLVSVDQRGIDVEVALVRPDGTVWMTVDGPSDSEGLETLLLPAGAAGPFEIRVQSPNPGAAPAAYTVRADELAESTPAERRRVEAERLMTEAAVRTREGTGTSQRLAAARYEEARAAWRSLGDGAEEARCALAIGAVHASLGEPKLALESYRQALALFVEPGDEPGQAAAWAGIGLAQTALGSARDSIASLRRAVELEHGLRSRVGQRYEEAKTRNNLGFALHTAGELRQAQAVYEQALGELREAGETGRWETAVLQNLAAVSTTLAEPEAALRFHLQVVERRHAQGNPLPEARALNNLGVLYVNLGAFAKALEAYASALAIFRRAGDRLWEGALLHNLGVAYYDLGDTPQAVVDLEQAASIRHETGDRKGEIATGVALGRTLASRGETARALAAGRQAAAQATAIEDRQGEMLGRLLAGEASVAGGEPQAALAELARARELASLLDDRLDEPRILRGLGQAHLALRQPGEAIGELEQAVAAARAAGSPGRLLEALTALAAAERSLGRLEEARARVEEALPLVESLRVAETDPELRASLLASKHQAFELEIDLLMDLDRREPGRGHAGEALEASERSRARSLLDLLEEAGTGGGRGIDPGLYDRERALLVRLNAKTGRLDGLLRQAAAEDHRRAAEREVRSVLEDLVQVEAAIRRADPRYAMLNQPRTASSRELQALLDGETLLLEYSLGAEHSYLWLVDRRSVSGFELPPQARIEAAARQLYGRLSVLAPGDGGGEAAAALGRMLLGPAAGKLGSKRLIVVADGELQYIPFGALPDPERGGSTSLLARHEIVGAPSGSAVVLERRLARPHAAPRLVAVLADPVFDRSDPRVAASGAGGAGGAASSAERSPVRSSATFLRLPWTRREAEAIGAVAPAGQSLLALGFRASLETARSAELARYRIVHFATHGVVDSQTPSLSGLMLSRVGERGAPIEGFLGLRDIYDLRLGADLVVLSGCETALGKQVRGEGLVGLTQGFLYAGARQVLASLWRVEDRSTAELMSRFYRALLVDGRPPAAALRQAQLAIRRDRRWRAPYYWSGFVLLGDARPAPHGLG